jgi:alpha-L-arabinofuranosidase
VKRKKIVLDLDGVIADIDTAVSNHLLDESGAKIDYSSWFTTDTKNKEALKLVYNIKKYCRSSECFIF